MIKTHNLLENVLIDIDKYLDDGINSHILAKKNSLSEGHLRRLFRFSYKRTIAGYIRSRKLKASLDDLLENNSNVLDIALKYGFEYEQSYIRAFKREFGITPGDFRKLNEFYINNIGFTG